MTVTNDDLSNDDLVICDKVVFDWWCINVCVDIGWQQDSARYSPTHVSRTISLDDAPTHTLSARCTESV